MSDSDSSEEITLEDIYEQNQRILKRLDVILKRLDASKNSGFETVALASSKTDDGYMRIESQPMKSKGTISVSDILAGAHKFQQ